MGGGASVQSFTAEEVGDYVAKLGSAYVPYRALFIENGFTGESNGHTPKGMASPNEFRSIIDVTEVITVSPRELMTELFKIQGIRLDPQDINDACRINAFLDKICLSDDVGSVMKKFSDFNPNLYSNSIKAMEVFHNNAAASSTSSVTTGTKKYSDGSVYTGELLNNKRHGRGSVKHSDGGVFEGMWSEDKKEGKGHMIWSDGTVYEGDYHQGDRHGHGAYKNIQGDLYVGDWVKNNKQGK
eukprot:gene30807-38076_t